MELNQILNENFEKAAFGYRPEEVAEHLNNVANYVMSLKAENETTTQKMTILAEKLKEYRDDENNMKEALLGAQRLGKTVVDDANAKAQATINEANAKAEAMINDSNAKAEATLLDANNKAETMLREAHQKFEQDTRTLSIQLAAEENNLAKMQKEVSEFKSHLLTTYKTHLDIITALPEIDPADYMDNNYETEYADEQYDDYAGPEFTEEEQYSDETMQYVEEQQYEEEVQIAPQQEQVDFESFEKLDAEFAATAADESEFAAPEQETAPDDFLDTNFDEKSFESKFGELKFGKNLDRD